MQQTGLIVLACDTALQQELQQVALQLLTGRFLPEPAPVPWPAVFRTFGELNRDEIMPKTITRSDSCRDLQIFCYVL